MNKEQKQQKKHIKNSKRKRTIHLRKLQQNLKKARVNQMFRKAWLLDKLDKKEGEEKLKSNKK